MVKFPSCFSRAVMLLALSCACALPTVGLCGQDRGDAPVGDKAQDAAAKQSREKSLQDLRRRAASTEVWSVPWQCVPGRNEYPTYVHFMLPQEAER
jgi:hypothetical protein